MDAEILFFMTAKDQSDFLKITDKYCDSITENPDTKQMTFQVGRYDLLFTPTIKEKNTLFIGKLEIRLSSVSEQFETKDQERAKAVYRKLRNCIKKYYWSRLAYSNKNKAGKLTPSRNHWLGPDAKLWKESDKEKHILKLSQTSWMIFELGY